MTPAPPTIAQLKGHRLEGMFAAIARGGRCLVPNPVCWQMHRFLDGLPSSKNGDNAIRAGDRAFLVEYKSATDRFIVSNATPNTK
jgi:hypothetical protein